MKGLTSPPAAARAGAGKSADTASTPRARLDVERPASTPGILWPLLLQAWMHDLAILGHQRALDDLIVPIHLQHLVLLVEHGLQKRQQILGIKSRGVDGYLARQVQGSCNRHALVLHDLVGLRQLGVAAALSR